MPFALASAIDEPTYPAWRHKPSWYVLTTQDRMIPPDTQRFISKRMKATVVEVAASDVVCVSRPDIFVEATEKAANAR